jgi:hypothetical protein
MKSLWDFMRHYFAAALVAGLLCLLGALSFFFFGPSKGPSWAVVFGERPLDESRVVRLTMRSHLSEEAFIDLVQRNEVAIQAVLDKLSLTDLSDKERIHLAHRSIKQILGSQSDLVEMSIDASINPQLRKPDPELIKALKKSHRNLGYTGNENP